MNVCQQRSTRSPGRSFRYTACPAARQADSLGSPATTAGCSVNSANAFTSKTKPCGICCVHASVAPESGGSCSGCCRLRRVGRAMRSSGAGIRHRAPQKDRSRSPAAACRPTRRYHRGWVLLAGQDLVVSRNKRWPVCPRIIVSGRRSSRKRHPFYIWYTG